MKSATRLATLIAASLTTVALVLPLGACGVRRGDPATPARSWSTSHLPVRYDDEDPAQRDDLPQVQNLSDEHGVRWYHYAATTDGGLRVFFPSLDGCAYRAIVRETMQYVGVAVVEGGAEDAVCDSASDDRDGPYSSMLVSLSRPIARRPAVELADLVATAINPKTVGDGPRLGNLATDVSAIPEVLWGRHPDMDLLFLEGSAYGRSDETGDSGALTPAGTVGRTVTSGDFLRDWDATRLRPGTQILRLRDQSRLRPSMLYAEAEGTLIPYRILAEG